MRGRRADIDADREHAKLVFLAERAAGRGEKNPAALRFVVHLSVLVIVRAGGRDTAARAVSTGCPAFAGHDSIWRETRRLIPAAAARDNRARNTRRACGSRRLLASCARRIPGAGTDRSEEHTSE